jgi:hypothetical protein
MNPGFGRYALGMAFQLAAQGGDHQADSFGRAGGVRDKVTADEVNQAMKQAAEGNESFGYTEEEIVSSDIWSVRAGHGLSACRSGRGSPGR